jgi:hypothetical protein
MGGEDETRICCGVTFVCLVIWIGLFAGLNVPQMKRMDDYLKTKCFVNDSVIIRRYCPTKTCPACNSFTGASCSSVMNQMEAISPDTCNTTCPGNQFCDNGHYCCNTVCNTYTDSKGHRHTSCYCSSDTDHHQCTIVPRLCYTLRLFLQYNTTDSPESSDSAERSVWTEYDFDTGDNGPKAFEYQTVKYQKGHTYTCFYNTHNLAKIRWTIGYTVGFWVASGLFALFTFCGCIASCSSFIQEDNLNRKPCLQMTNFWFWIAIVLGLCLFLPLGLDIHIPEPSRTHLLRLAIVWTTMWTGFFLIYLFLEFNGCACVERLLESCCGVLRGCSEASWKLGSRFRAWFWTKWVEMHAWSRRNIDEGLCVRCNAFFCYGCNWCVDTVRYIAKERGQGEQPPSESQPSSEIPPSSPDLPPPSTAPPPEQDALSGIVVAQKFDSSMRLPSYRTAMAMESGMVAETGAKDNVI